jgi:hypothetical protein
MTQIRAASAAVSAWMDQYRVEAVFAIFWIGFIGTLFVAP